MTKWSDIIPQQTFSIGTQLAERAKAERNMGKCICPPQDQIFRALSLTPPDRVKVCIVGQDPYHTPGAANGLAFSIASDKPLQPSLTNIFKELESDLRIPKPRSGDLTKWAENGVLLLNTSLTVYEHQANSHINWGWNKFTAGVLQAATHLPQPIVFILWGSSAHSMLDSLIQKAAVYDNNGFIVQERLVKKAYLLSSHPSPFSCRKMCKNHPPFVGSRPFSTTNKLLVEMGGESVNWNLN